MPEGSYLVCLSSVCVCVSVFVCVCCVCVCAVCVCVLCLCAVCLCCVCLCVCCVCIYVYCMCCICDLCTHFGKAIIVATLPLPFLSLSVSRVCLGEISELMGASGVAFFFK